MIKKVSIIILFLFCFGMVTGIVAASDVNETVEVDTLSVSEDVEPLKDNSGDEANFTTLANDIDNGGSTVILSKDYSMQDGESSVVITKDDLTIDGQGHTINANKKGMIFELSASRVTFKNIVFVNAVGGNGAAIGNFYVGNTYYTVIDCTFMNNTASNCGGALYSYSSPIYAYNSIFIDNSNTGTYGGGAIFSDVNIYVEGCKFYGNTASKGSAIRSRGSVSVVGCTFNGPQSGNEIPGYVQANSIESSNNILSFTDLKNIISGKTNVKLDYDFVYSPDYDAGYAGGISLNTNNLFIDGQGHTIDGVGLAKMFSVSGNNVTFYNITFINGYSVNGGAIGDFYGSGKYYTVISCNFRDNTATNCGGALYSNNNPIYVYNSTFTNNRNIGNFGGGAIFSDGDIYVSGCSFQANSIAKSDGSAIRSNRGLVSVSNSVFLQTQKGYNSIQASRYDVSDSYSSFTDLNNLIGSYSEYSNAVVNLRYDYRYLPEYDKSGITISTTLITINGNGYNIDACGNSLCIFNVTADDVALKNMNILNGYAKDINNMGTAVSWSGSNGRLDNVTLKNNIFDSSKNAGNYNWWDSGIIYWNGPKGVINNVRVISNKVVSSKGIIIWVGSDGVINNSYFYDCSNAYNGYVGYFEATSFFIYWNADNGKFLNSRVEDLKLSTRDVSKPCYVSFIKPGQVVNVTFSNCQHSNRGQTVYDLDMPFVPVEDYVKNFTGTYIKQTPSVTVPKVVTPVSLLTLTVNTVRSGSITYSIDNGESHTVNVDNNGQARIGVSGLSDGSHKITYSYIGNDFYNSVSAQTSNFVFTSYLSNLTFTEIKKSNNQYNYSFILDLKDLDDNYVNIAINYDIILANGNKVTISGRSNELATWQGSVALLNLTARFNSLELEPNYYPLNALQMLIDNANDGDTIALVHDYIMQSGENPITISKNNLVIDGRQHTIDANSLNKLLIVSGSGVVLKNTNFINGNSINGGAIRWNGNNGKLLDCNFINCKSPFWGVGTTDEAGGAVSWTGDNGLMDRCYFNGCNAQGGGGGSIHWSGNNGVINNTNIINTTMYSCNYDYGIHNGAFAICWTGLGGKLLNTNIANPLKTGYNVRPYVVDFVNGQGWIDNLKITGQTEGNSIFVPYCPVEDQIGNINVNMPIYKYTPNITFENGIFTVNSVRSGVVSYYIGSDSAKTALVDENGHFTIDYDFNPQQNYFIKVIYHGNTFYNLAFGYFDYNNGITDDVFGSFTELNNLISQSSGSVINLYKNYIYDPVTDSALANGIPISKSITINGYGHYIDADYNAVRIFTTSANVVLNNITFKNSRLNEAGNAILANAPININYCTFDNNWAYGSSGGAINLAGGNSNINYCTFTNNKAEMGSAIVVNSKNNHIQYSTFENNAKGYGADANYGSDILVAAGQNAYVNYNAFLDSRPLAQVSTEYSHSNWYGKNALPDSSDSGAPRISNYLKASLDYTLNNNVLTVGIVFSESDTDNIINVPWSRTVVYAVSSSTVIGDNLNRVAFSGVDAGFIINAVIDNQTLTLTNNNHTSWYVNGSVASAGHGTLISPSKALMSAINLASNGDTIYIAPGIYKGSGNNVNLNINKALTIERWGDSGEVIFDGENSNRIFNLNSNIIISSLTFKNAKNSNGGAIVSSGNSVIINSIFTDNYASSQGGAIFLTSGNTTIVNSQFINNNAPSDGGAISTTSSGVTINIVNSIFTNNIGDKGGAISIGSADSNLQVIGSTFKDNYAKSYGGALAFSGAGDVKDSIFINNTAYLGGGAVYMWGDSHLIVDSRFANNSANYGGAIIVLSGELNLYTDYFDNNTARAFGGVVYNNLGNLTVFGGDYSNNRAYYDGGAIYLYKGFNSIYETLFKANIAGYGGGAVHSLANDLYCVRMNMLNNISADLNGYVNTIYLNSFIDYGNYTLVVADTSNYNGALPSYFSLVDNGWDTSVKNQGSLGSCWDFATIAMLETALKKATGIEYDLSENNVKNIISWYSAYGWNRDPNRGAGQWDGSSYLVNSMGPIYESEDVTSHFGFSPLVSNTVHVSNIALASRSRDNPLANDEVKRALMMYGGVRASMHVGPSKGYNFYQDETTTCNHAVTIVGWDDNYSKDNFPDGCPGNGAWIVKNSWGSGSGKDGYIYISYYDTSFAWTTLAYVIFNDTIQYNRVYQYDYGNYGMRTSGSSVSWYKNIFTSVKDEKLTAFSTFFEGVTDWEVSVYVNDVLEHVQNGTSISAGYFTFNFDRPIHIAKGDVFTIEVKVNSNRFPTIGKGHNTLTCGDGVSYYSKDGKTWTDLNNDNQMACLKVFTQNRDIVSIIEIDPIESKVYGNDIIVNFTVSNPTTVGYILKNKNGETIREVKGIGNNQIIFSGLSMDEYIITIINYDANGEIENSKSANFNILRFDTVWISPDGTGTGVSRDSPTTWENVYNLLADNGTVMFMSGTYNDFYGNQLTKDWTLIGEGEVILDANKKGNMFSLSAYNATFINLTFINGNGGNGGAIGDFYGGDKTCTVINCKFINNTANGCGGALYSQNNPIYVYNSTFINNRNDGRYGGGAIFCYWM